MDRREFLATTTLMPSLGLLAQQALAKPAKSAKSAKDDGPWIQLFNGKDLAGWTPKVRGYHLGHNYADTFRVENGAIAVRYDKYKGPFHGKYGHLFYKDRLTDYVLRVEYRFTGKQADGGPDWALRNSGLMLHCQDPETMEKGQSYPASIEVQLLGGDGKSQRPTANLCTPGTNVVMNGKLHTDHCTNSTSDTFTDGEWVTVEVEVRAGNTIRHSVNGKTVLEYSQPQLDPNDADAQRLLAAGWPKMLTGGWIALQSESHPVEFRKVELKKLPTDWTKQTEPLQACDRVELSDPKSFMLVALPDTQIYTVHQNLNKHFDNQAQWIADNAERLNIKYVLHEGDIVNNNRASQWEVARDAMKRLHGKASYALAPGNHDYGENGSSKDRSTLLNEYFSAEEYAKQPGFGGLMEAGTLENSYHTFEAGGQKYLILALEWGPRDQAVEWANKIADEHKDHRMILVTHAYVYFDETRYDWARKGKAQIWNPHDYPNGKLAGGANDGEELWNKLVRKFPGFVLTLNGHVLEDGAGQVESRGDHGNTVHQLMANYQNRFEGGEGYLRLIEFLPDGQTIKVRSFSPSTNKLKIAGDQQFELKYKSAQA